MSGPGHIALIGLMGTGKTATARELAARLGRPHLDTDEMVCAAAGVSVAEIFAEAGEAGFRAHEARAVAAALGSSVPAVISLGGGAVLDPSTRLCLAGAAAVVWLHADPAVLAERLGGARVTRPLLVDSGRLPAEVLCELAGERGAIYEGLADVSVDVGPWTVVEVAAIVLDRLGLGGVSPDQPGPGGVSPGRSGVRSR